MSASDPTTATVAALMADVLAHAGRCLAVTSWPAPSPPEGTPDVPAIEVQDADEGGAPAVFAFATVVADDGPCHAPLEIRRGEVEDDVAIGDEVGLELPIGRVAALAWALLSAQIERDDDDVFVPLPAGLWQALRDSGRLDAVLHGLAGLLERFAAPPTPALSHLTRLAGLDERRCRAALRVANDDGPGSLLVLAVDDGGARVVIVPGTTGRQAVRTLGEAVPPPTPPSTTALWHHLARPTTWGPAAVAGPFRADVTTVDVSGQDVVVTLRLELLDGDGGDVTVKDARESRCTLPAPPLLLQAAIDDEDVARATETATRFLRRSLEAAAELRLAPERVLHGSAWARVVARAACGVALEPRGNTALELSEMDDEGRVVVEIGDFAGRCRLVLSPADDALLVPVGAHRTGVPANASQWPVDATGEVLRPAYQAGRTIDGDDEAARAVCLALAAALDGGDADLELVLVDDDGSERELLLSSWLRGLADLPAVGRLPPHASARDAFADVVDALLDER